MGRVAETAAIGCLKDRDEWVRKEACGVLAEVGGQASLNALRQYARHASDLERMDADRAIEAITKNLRAAADKPKTPAAEIAVNHSRPAWRVWHDTSGVFEVEAAMVRFEDGKLTLKKRDGRTLVVPVNKLSRVDQVYVTQHAEAK
jgi:hypothetical protein